MRFSLRFWKRRSTEIADYVVDEGVEAASEFQQHRIVYKDEAINALVAQVPPYVRGAAALGDLAVLKNGVLVRIIEWNGRLSPVIISPYLSREAIAEFLQKLETVVDHRKLATVRWPSQQDPEFTRRIQAIYAELGYVPDGADRLDPTACQKLRAQKTVALKYYQKIASTTLVYGPYRGLLVWHSLGSGKTCTAIAAIDQFLTFWRNERRGPLSGGGAPAPAAPAPKIFIVLPPKKSLDNNMRKELANSCPSIVKELVDRARLKGSKVDMANRIINKHVTIVSYVSLANKLKRGTVDLEGALVIADEAHNLNEPPPQFAKQYAYLVERIKATKQCKVLLMTATPIYKSLGDLSRLLNLLKRPGEAKLPETEDGFVKRYFDAEARLRGPLLAQDIRGLISFVDVEGDLSYFAKRINTSPVVTHTTAEHYAKWERARAAEDGEAGVSEGRAESNAMVDAVLTQVAKLENVPSFRLIEGARVLVSYMEAPIQMTRDMYVQLNTVTTDPKTGGISMIQLTIVSNTAPAADITRYVRALHSAYKKELENALGDTIYYFDQKSRAQDRAPPIAPGASSVDQRRMRVMTAPRQLLFTKAPFFSNKRFSNTYGEQVRAVQQRVEFFEQNEAWYNERGIPYQLGLLLSGEPGGGKTSAIRAIANYTKRHIVNVNFANITTATQLKNLLTSDKLSVFSDSAAAETNGYTIPINRRLYVLEEIDAIGDIVKQRRPNGGATEAVEDELTLMEILTALDGTMETPGRILIMTSNNPEVLDQALIRPGRIDVSVDFTCAPRALIAEMYAGYYGKTLSADKAAQLPDRQLSPAEAGQVLFRHFVEVDPEAILADLHATAGRKAEERRARELRAPEPPASPIPTSPAAAPVAGNPAPAAPGPVPTTVSAPPAPVPAPTTKNPTLPPPSPPSHLAEAPLSFGAVAHVDGQLCSAFGGVNSAFNGHAGSGGSIDTFFAPLCG